MVVLNPLLMTLRTWKKRQLKAVSGIPRGLLSTRMRFDSVNQGSWRGADWSLLSTRHYDQTVDHAFSMTCAKTWGTSLRTSCTGMGLFCAIECKISNGPPSNGNMPLPTSRVQNMVPREYKSVRWSSEVVSMLPVCSGDR